MKPADYQKPLVNSFQYYSIVPKLEERGCPLFDILYAKRVLENHLVENEKIDHYKVIQIVKRWHEYNREQIDTFDWIYNKNEARNDMKIVNMLVPNRLALIVDEIKRNETYLSEQKIWFSPIKIPNWILKKAGKDISSSILPIETNNTNNPVQTGEQTIKTISKGSTNPEIGPTATLKENIIKGDLSDLIRKTREIAELQNSIYKTYREAYQKVIIERYTYKGKNITIEQIENIVSTLKAQEKYDKKRHP